MSLVAIELNDAGLVAVDATDEASAPSPGYALVERDELLVGQLAAGSARLKPRWVNNRFWHQLDTAPLPHPFPRRLSHADLAHAHLKELWKPFASEAKGVILALPGSWSEAQLGLVLGIARACAMPVQGLVDGAVAAAAGRPGERLLHLDLGLHHAALTELRQTTVLERSRVELSEQTGLAPLLDVFMKRIAQLFVHQTRFDPLHAGETEQKLYNRLPRWLEELGSAQSTVVSFEAGGKEHAVELTRAALMEAAEAHYAHILQLVGLLRRPGEPTTLLVSRRLGELPGLEPRLAELGRTQLVSLPAAASARGALAWSEHIASGGEELPFVTQLPATRSAQPADRLRPPEPEEQLASRQEPPPTHLLHAGRAYALGSEPFLLGTAIPEGRRGLNLTGFTAGVSRSHCRFQRRDGQVVVEDSSSWGTYLNGDRIEGSALVAAGDKLRLGAPGIEVELIVVEREDETPLG